jgi:hypothetical protein
VYNGFLAGGRREIFFFFSGENEEMIQDTERKKKFNSSHSFPRRTGSERYWKETWWEIEEMSGNGAEDVKGESGLWRGRLNRRRSPAKATD